MPNELNREDWNAAAVAVLIAEPYNWPEKDAANYIAAVDFDENYNEGDTPEQAVLNDSYYWED